MPAPLTTTDPPQGWLPCKLVALFGPNYRTSVAGWVGRLGAVIAAVPQLAPTWRYTPYCTALGILISAAGFGQAASSAKDKTVSGSEPKESKT